MSSLLSKLGVGAARGTVEPQRAAAGRATAPLHTTTGDSGRGIATRPGRFSNGLKEFLWQLEGLRRGTLLDAGPPWQDTLNFFIERGFKVYTEDLLISWIDFQREEEQRLKLSVAGGEPATLDASLDASPAGRAQRFLESNLPYARDTFDAVLLWDVLDYLDRDAATNVVRQLSKMVRSGGVMLAVFHMRLPEQLHRYRVLDKQNLELVPAPAIAPPHHIYQNREIQDLFQGFRSSKFFVGRDQLREGVFTK
jgi:SAM-dependent methyltransferase